VSGDHRAFLNATLPYLDVVYQVARHAAGDGQEAEDLVQETYLRAYSAFGSYRDVADVVIAGLDAQEVSRSLALLPEPQRVCIVLMDVAGYTARETADMLGCPRGTVLARVHRGRRRLARLLAGAGVSHGRS
jgi:RNA polymerase sigma-70 factor, ECF subfamily